ncbi:RNA-directed DNA polymerase, eukaryota, partial [Tanacetum coccineum]
MMGTNSTRYEQDRLPSKLNLLRRGVQVDNLMCPICNSVQEDISHVLFTCEVAAAITRLVCRWWDVDRESFSSYMDWLSWFKNIRLGSKIKSLLEGVFYTAWWALWNFRNHEIFASKKPRKEVIFDDIVACSFSWISSR